MSPGTRRAREQAILQILAERDVQTQGELVGELEALGFGVTQATVSRDVRRLGVVKLPSAEGTARYVPPEAAGEPPDRPGGGRTARDELAAVFRESVVAVDAGDALLAVRTPPGRANAVAITIDGARIPEIVATVAGDDTIFLLMRNQADRRIVRRALESLF